MIKNQHLTSQPSSPRPAKHSEAGSNSGDPGKLNASTMAPASQTVASPCRAEAGDADKKSKKRRPWTPERRAAQAARCRAAKPSRHATGPKTPAGKAAASQNALKHGFYSETVRELRRLLRMQKLLLRATFPVTAD